jgi:predicted ATPase
MGFKTSKGRAQWFGYGVTPSDAQSVSFPADHLFVTLASHPPVVQFAEALRWMGFYNVYPEAIRRLQRPLPEILLEPDGSNLASVVGELGRRAPETLERVKEYLANIAEEVTHFEVRPYGEYETLRFRLRSAVADRPLELDAAGMSDGTLRALSNIMAVFQIIMPHGHPSVIGIEEPETELHPAALRALVDALREATQHTQVLLSTHSPDLLADRYLNLAQILVVRSRGGLTQIGPVDAASREIVQKELYTLADLQRMDHLEPDAADVARQNRSMTGDQEK